MYTFLLINLVVCGNYNNKNRVYLPVNYYIWLGNFENFVAKTNGEGHFEGSLEGYLEGSMKTPGNSGKGVQKDSRGVKG